MTIRYLIRREFSDISPFLDAIRTQADSEREALGFLPEPAYAEAARQRKLILLVCQREDQSTYAGHLLFGGIFPSLRVRQISIAPPFRRRGHATNLLRTLISQGEKEGYLGIVANVASDLTSANSFYEKHDFILSRIKAGGNTRNRKINVRILDLKTPSLISMMVGPHQPKTIEIVQPTRRSFEAPIYAIDLNVFFDAIRDRERSEDAGAVFEAAFRHQVRLATTQEFLLELKRKSISGSNDPVLAFAKRIPILPSQSKAALEKLQHSIAEIVFPERSARAKLSENDVADTSHLAHAIAGGASGYVTSDGKILNARDSLIAKYDLDVIGLSEFVDLLELPEINAAPPPKGTNNFRLQTRSDLEISTFIKRQNIEITHFLASEDLSSHRCLSIRDDDGIIGASVVSPSSGIDQASRAIVCVDQSHTFASTIADYLISDLCSQLSSAGPHHLSMLDIPSHPITRRIALSQGFQRHDQIALSKISFGRPITTNSWPAARRAIERLAGIKLQQPCPAYDAKKIKMITSRGEEPTISPSELETFLSPTIFAFSNRKAVIVPISRSYAADLLGTDQQYSLLDVPEATFMSRRTYFNTTNAARAMIRGAVIAFYENGKKGGRGAIVALGRIVDVTTVPVGNIPEKLGRGAVVEDIGAITSAPRVLATTFDNLIPLQNPVKLKRLREIGCDTRTNFISATPVSASHLKAIVDAGFSK